jgi:hypothetical protein
LPGGSFPNIILGYFAVSREVVLQRFLGTFSQRNNQSNKPRPDLVSTEKRGWVEGLSVCERKAPSTRAQAMILM